MRTKQTQTSRSQVLTSNFKNILQSSLAAWRKVAAKSVSLVFQRVRFLRYLS
ncbi:hypothetical protein OH492_24870 [Vibrio chagasii]|nr:hypothetical protein [Vibrio chagasii]